MTRTEAANGPTPGESLTLAISDDLNMVFSWVPAGEFMMGSTEREQGHEAEESPRHLVRLNRGFYMGRFAVTVRQWETVMGRGQDEPGDEERPIVMTSWYEAKEFAERLSRRSEDWKFSSPTEAQWEYACRAGSDTRFAGGDTEQDLALGAWYGANGGGQVHPVGKKAPNGWQLYDMHGNVFEWCDDWEGAYFEADQTEPTGPASGQKRILRGGCFKCPPQYCRSANRYSGLPDHRNTNIGFRLIAGQL